MARVLEGETEPGLDTVIRQNKVVRIILFAAQCGRDLEDLLKIGSVSNGIGELLAHAARRHSDGAGNLDRWIACLQREDCIGRSRNVQRNLGRSSICGNWLRYRFKLKRLSGRAGDVVEGRGTPAGRKAWWYRARRVRPRAERSPVSSRFPVP